MASKKKLIRRLVKALRWAYNNLPDHAPPPATGAFTTKNARAFEEGREECADLLKQFESY